MQIKVSEKKTSKGNTYTYRYKITYIVVVAAAIADKHITKRNNTKIQQKSPDNIQ